MSFSFFIKVIDENSETNSCLKTHTVFYFTNYAVLYFINENMFLIKTRLYLMLHIPTSDLAQ